MAVRNSSVARGYLTTSGLTVVYTVPAGFVLLLKNIAIQQTSGLTTDFLFQLVEPTLPTIVSFATGTAGTSGIFYWSGWTALNAGDELRISVTNPTVSYWISGALLPFNAAL